MDFWSHQNYSKKKYEWSMVYKKKLNYKEPLCNLRSSLANTTTSSSIGDESLFWNARVFKKNPLHNEDNDNYELIEISHKFLNTKNSFKKLLKTSINKLSFTNKKVLPANDNLKIQMINETKFEPKYRKNSKLFKAKNHDGFLKRLFNDKTLKNGMFIK